MDSYEATRVVFSKIQSLDPENASKIMGFILIQDYGDHEMTRLAFGPESLLHSLVLKAKSHLSLSLPSPSLTSTSTPPSASSPSPLNPISRRPINHHLSIPSAPTTSLSYANVVNGTSNNNNGNTTPTNNNNASNSDPVDEYHELQAHLSFLNDAKSDDLGDTSPLHRRSYSVTATTCLWPSSNANNNSEDSSFTGFGGWKPCLYFARGFCKNGSNCRFLHGGDSAADCTDAAVVGSPTSNLFSEFEPSRYDFVRPKLAQQQQMQQLMTGVGPPNLPNYGKYMNLFSPLQQNDAQRSTVAELLMGEELQKFRHFRPERNDFLALGLGLGGAISPGSKQIYLTFPADSTFREEDVSNYFSNYGPVQDVRIPYQQKRMFGFVTFVYPETVKLILAKGNPHFVCDSRVLVKPYKEKGKISDRKQQQFMDRGEYSACLSPTGFESRDPFDLPLGSRMGYNSQDMLRRKLEEQADLHHAIELQGRRLMNLQLLDIKNRNRQYPHNIPTGSPISSPVLSCSPSNRSLNLPPNAMNQQVPKEFVETSWMPVNSIAVGVGGENQALQDAVRKDYIGKRKEENSDLVGESDLHESLEHILPDNLFGSPKKSAGENLTVFTNCLSESDEVTSLITPFAAKDDLFLPTSSPLNIASLNTCFLQMPSFSSGHGTVGM